MSDGARDPGSTKAGGGSEPLSSKSFISPSNAVGHLQKVQRARAILAIVRKNESLVPDWKKLARLVHEAGLANYRSSYTQILISRYWLQRRYWESEACERMYLYQFPRQHNSDPQSAKSSES